MLYQKDIMENRKDIFLDIATRYNKYYLKNISASGVEYLLVKGLFAKEWLTEFSDSNLEAYYAYRDKFLDNKDSGRTQITPFSNADITRVATSLDTSDKRNNLWTHKTYVRSW